MVLSRARQAEKFTLEPGLSQEQMTMTVISRRNQSRDTQASETINNNNKNKQEQQHPYRQ